MTIKMNTLLQFQVKGGGGGHGGGHASGGHASSSHGSSSHATSSHGSSSHATAESAHGTSAHSESAGHAEPSHAAAGDPSHSSTPWWRPSWGTPAPTVTHAAPPSTSTSTVSVPVSVHASDPAYDQGKGTLNPEAFVVAVGILAGVILGFGIAAYVNYRNSNS